MSPSAAKFEGTSSEIVGIPIAVFVIEVEDTPSSLSFPAGSTHTTA